jgi:hypothetical protein
MTHIGPAGGLRTTFIGGLFGLPIFLLNPRKKIKLRFV